MPSSAQEGPPVLTARAGALQRELIRQALLIAARDELGLLTRDEMLGERFSAAPKASSGLEIQTISAPNGLIRVIISQPEESGRMVLFERDLTKTATNPGGAAISDPPPEDLADLAEQTEAISRTELPAVLRKLGLEGKSNQASSGGQVPETIENRLGSLGFAEIFSAIKDLHTLIRSDGESPARIGALARGYAILGVLSEFQWHPAHKAYKARALLYAQRLCAAAERGPWFVAQGLHSGALGLALSRHGRPESGRVCRRLGRQSRCTILGRANFRVRAVRRQGARIQTRPGWQAGFPAPPELARVPATGQDDTRCCF